MDIYRALNADVPLSLFMIWHQTDPTLSSEDYARLVTALHNDVNSQTTSLEDELQRWQQKYYLEQAEELVRKLQRLGFLSEKANGEQLQDMLIRDYQRMGSRIGSRALIGMLGATEIAFDEKMVPVDAELARLSATGQRYIASLGFKPGRGAMHESCLLFRGSVHYDIMEHLVRTRASISQKTSDNPLAYLRHMVINTYDLAYQTGEGLAAEPHEAAPMQQVTFAINKNNLPYSLFRRDVSILMEDIGEHVLIFHASFWQRKLGLGVGREFMLRFRLLEGEEHLLTLVHTLNTIGPLGKEIAKHGALLLGNRIL